MSSPQTIPVLERAILLLDAIVDSPFGLSAKALTLQLNIPQATCYRILRTLTRKGLLREQSDGVYLPAYGLARWARSWSALENTLQRVRPLAEELSVKTGLSVKISIREGSDSVIVLRTEAQRPNSITSPVGSRIPITESGSVGMMLLASVPAKERIALLKKADGCLKKVLLQQAEVAEKQGIARSYGIHHPSIFAVSKLIHIGIPASVTLVGWPEDFVGRKKREHETALKRSFADFQSACRPEKPCFLSP